MPKKHIKRVCKNCKLYNPERGECSVVILHEGQRLRLPVDPDDNCFYEGVYFDPTTKAMEDFAGEINQARFWVEGSDGKPTDGNGTVKMEFPDGFFGQYEEGIFELDDEPKKT